MPNRLVDGQPAANVCPGLVVLVGSELTAIVPRVRNTQLSDVC